jgi:4-amino-4-deoxy-L-arabinose transferase-like glycosyltransferase
MAIFRPARRALGPRSGLLVLCGLLFFAGLGTAELCRNEGLRALVAVEVLRGGHWAVPTLHGEPLLTKPPGMPLAIALASLPAGAVSAATARLPSALAATVALFLFYSSFRRTVGARAGLVAGALLPCSVLWLEAVPSAEIDMVQLGWVTAALLFFLRALESVEECGRGGAWWPAALLCVAGGTLTKWTAPAFFYLTAVPLLAWRGRLRLLGGRGHLLALALAAALCAGWAAVVAGEVGWDALADTVRREALQRLSPAHHGRPYPWKELATFPLPFLLASLPAGAAAVFACRPGFADRWGERGRRLWQLLHCWAWPNLLFWTLVPGHKARHALPLQPALAGLAALAWVAWLARPVRNAEGGAAPGGRDGLGVVPARALIGLVAIWVVVKLTFTLWFVPERDRPRRPRATGEQLAALVPPGQPLYLFRLKDDGVLFYYGRPTQRLSGPAALPAAPLYCLLLKQEWGAWPAERRAEVVGQMRDQQGAELVLVRAQPHRPAPP